MNTSDGASARDDLKAAYRAAFGRPTSVADFRFSQLLAVWLIRALGGGFLLLLAVFLLGSLGSSGGTVNELGATVLSWGVVGAAGLVLAAAVRDGIHYLAGWRRMRAASLKAGAASPDGAVSDAEVGQGIRGNRNVRYILAPLLSHRDPVYRTGLLVVAPLAFVAGMVMYAQFDLGILAMLFILLAAALAWATVLAIWRFSRPSVSSEQPKLHAYIRNDFLFATQVRDRLGSLSLTRRSRRWRGAMVLGSFAAIPLLSFAATAGLLAVSGNWDPAVVLASWLGMTIMLYFGFSWFLRPS